MQKYTVMYKLFDQLLNMSATNVYSLRNLCLFSVVWVIKDYFGFFTLQVPQEESNGPSTSFTTIKPLPQDDFRIPRPISAPANLVKLFCSFQKIWNFY